ncbi:MAG: DUF4249 domain-containing protein [Chitinophagales bacterium]
MTQQAITILFLVFSTLFFQSCEEEVDIDLDNIDPVLVVEALISNAPDKTPYVKLNMSGDYFDNKAPETVSNALVIITEDNLLSDTLMETKPGYYETQNIQAGKINSDYQLYIKTANGEIYEADGRLHPVAPLDSLSVFYREETPFSYDEDGYYVTINFQEPAATRDFYRLFFYLGKVQYDPEELIYASDDLANGQYIRNIEFSEFVVFPGDTVRVEMHSLTEQYYNFLSSLDENQNSGDLFDTPPSNIQGNISNGAFGYFATSAITQITTIIEE